MAIKARGKNWLSIGRVGMYCLVSTATVRRWIKNGDLEAIRLPSGHFRVSIADFKDFLKRHEMPVGEELELYELPEFRDYAHEKYPQLGEDQVTMMADLIERGTGRIT